MSHMITISGAEYHFSGPAALGLNGRPIALGDIAHHLSMINRFTGATIRPYSVAEHSLLCADLAKRSGAGVYLQMAALMHDAHEAYTTDMSSPAKVAVNEYSMGAGGVQAWGLFEDVHAKAVRRHFNLVTAFSSYREKIREFDLIALATERRDLTAYDARMNGPWAILRDDTANPVQPADWINLGSAALEDVTWKQWRDRFLNRYFGLRAEMQDQSVSVQGSPLPLAARVAVAGTVC
jgi:hypothetical protein